MRIIIGKIIYKKLNFCKLAELDLNLINFMNIARGRICV